MSSIVEPSPAHGADGGGGARQPNSGKVDTMAATELERITPVAGWRRRTNDRPVAMAAIGALCISSSAVLMQLAAAGAATTAFFRCALALPFLVPLAIREQRRLGRRPARARLRAAGAGVFFAADLVFWAHTINAVGAGIATVLGNLQVVFVAAAAWVLFGERPTRRFVVSLPVLFAGVVLVSGLAGKPSFGGQPVQGILFGLGTSTTYAAFLLILRGAGDTTHVAGPLSDATAAAAVTAVLFGAVFGTLSLAPGWPSLGWLLLLAVTSQTVGWLFITSSLPRLPRAISSLMLLLQPVASLGLAAVVLSQRPTWLQLLGAGLILSGVLGVAIRATAVDVPDERAQSTAQPSP
jgi:drug/metabolite transporter (DMT)-like permease